MYWSHVEVIARRAAFSWSKKMTIELISAQSARGELFSDVSIKNV